MPPPLQSTSRDLLSLTRSYLWAYNTICAIFWLRIFLSTITTLTSPTIAAVHASLEPWTRWTQTLAVLEILHAATGTGHLSTESEGSCRLIRPSL